MNRQTNEETGGGKDLPTVKWIDRQTNGETGGGNSEKTNGGTSRGLQINKERDRRRKV